MRWIILGVGAIGGVIAGRLARAGSEVVAIARGAQLAALRTHALAVESPDERFVVTPTVVAAGEPVMWRDDDVIVLAVKTQDAEPALRALAAPTEVPVVCATNGVDAELIALRHASDVVAACVRMPATYLTPGVVQAWSSPVPGVIDVGRFPVGTSRAAEQAAVELRAAGFGSDVLPDIMRYKRAKLLSNLANIVVALCGEATHRSPLVDAARAEGRACFDAHGLDYANEDETAARATAVRSRPIAGSTRGGGSTWQSLARGTPLETDYLNGEIVRLGRLAGIATPVNAGLQRLAHAAEREHVAPGSMTLEAVATRLGN
jgi:2-dehydropantoate 2-reductase